MSKVYEAWKREAEKRLKGAKGIETIKIPSAVRRCPKCMNLTIEADVQKGSIRCSKCGFEMKFKMMR